MLSIAVATLSLSAPLMIGLPAALEGRKIIPLTWVFFRRGDRDRSQLAPAQIEAWQEEHVGNLGTLYRAKVARLAGPTGNAGDIRGIVLLEPRTNGQLKKDFAPDPFVREGLLKVDAFRVETVEGLTHPAVEPFEGTSLTLVFLKPGAKPARNAAGHRAYLQQLWEQGKLLFFAHCPGHKDLGGLLILATDKADESAAMAQADPMVQAGELVWETHPQYMGKGVLRPKGG